MSISREQFEQIFIFLWPWNFAERKACECIAAKVYLHNLEEFKLSCDGEESLADDGVNTLSQGMPSDRARFIVSL